MSCFEMSRMTQRLCVPYICLLCLVMLAAAPAVAAVPGLAGVLQDSSAASPTTPESPPSEEPQEPALPEKRAQVQEQLRIARQSSPETETDSSQASSQDAEKISLLKQLSLVYDQQESLAERTSELEQELTSAKKTLANLRGSGPDEPKPYSFFLREEIQDTLTLERDRLRSLEKATASIEDSLSRAKEAYEAKCKQRRLLEEKSEKTAIAPEQSVTKKDVELSTRECDIAKAKLEIRKTERINVRLERDILQCKLEFLADKLQLISGGVAFSQDDLDSKLRELKHLEIKSERRTKENETEVSILFSELSKARERLDRANNAKTSDTLAAEVAAKKLAHSLHVNRGDYYIKQSTWVERMRDLWKFRYRIATSDYQTVDLYKWLEESESLLQDIATERSLNESKLGELMKVLADNQSVESEKSETVANRWTSYQQQVVRDQVEFINKHIARAEATVRLAEKLIVEIKDRTSHFSLAEWLGVAWEKTTFVWNYELTTPAEDQPPLRVSSVVCGFLLLVLGYRMSRLLSRVLGRRILSRFGINEGGISALQSLSFYGLLFMSTLMALKVVNVPLTMFTFLGGAAAIGIGFGSQNILNNFISGLIMLTEQPVRVGDLIELDTVVGTIDSIGMRSTRIRTGSNYEIIVPNSTFLENNVVNWTLADSTVRCTVDVGVAYGSPCRDVAKQLKRAADEHGLVLSKPEPFVWFAGFGDNSLNFELYFYITIRSLSERRRIESDIRFMIDQYFREAGFTISFPQRDVHLDTLKPLEVRVLAAEEQAAETGLKTESKTAA